MDRLCNAVDVHAHFGQSVLGAPSLLGQPPEGTPARVVARARAAGVRLTFVSALQALWPRGAGNPIQGNLAAVRAVDEFPEDLRFWCVLSPKQEETFAQARELLTHPRCIGLKVHPVEHRYEIREFGTRIFEFAAERGAIVQSHSGEPGSWPADFVPLADAFPTVRLILSHLGCGADGLLDHQVRAVKAARHHNIWTDTSSAQSMRADLIERAVALIGADRILFGTDSPLYSTGAQVARIALAELTEKEKAAIFRENAASLFGLAKAAPRPKTRSK